jgi:hypothetical protein
MQLTEFWYISCKHYKWLKMTMWFPFWRFNSLYNGMSITPKKIKLSGEMQRSQLFFQIYTFLDSGFSTLLEYRNDFKFSEDFSTISLCKLTWLKPREISIMDLQLYKYPVVTSFVSFRHFYWDKDNHTIFFFVCKTVGRVDVGHHFESFTVATTTWLIVLGYLCHKWLRICSTCRKHFPVLSSFMTYISLLIKKTIAC